MTKLTKQKIPKMNLKITIPIMALLMCMSLFAAPVTAYASNENNAAHHIAPPTVEAEIIGSLLRIHTMSGFYAVEAVYVNDRRFNHRVDSALMIDVSGYIAAGDTIAVYAVDFAGNHSNTVLLSPPLPVPPPVPNNLTPEGQGAVLDHLSNRDEVEFITIETPTGNVFHLIIDHTRTSNNVYFLNPVTEWDLLTLAAEAELAIPIHIAEMNTPAPQPVITEREPPEETPEPSPPEEDKGGGRTGMYIFLLIAGVGAFGAVYYLKILKPKKEREMYSGDEEEYEEDDGFEDIDENTADSDTDSDD